MNEIEGLIEIQKEVAKVKQGDLSFNDYFYKKWDMEKPLRDWVDARYKHALMYNGLVTNDQIYNKIKEDDIKLASIGDVGPEEKEKIQQDIITLYEDSIICVKIILDYDCDTTLCKYWATHKPTGFGHRYCQDLGTKYLPGGIQIQL